MSNTERSRAWLESKGIGHPALKNDPLIKGIVESLTRLLDEVAIEAKISVWNGVYGRFYIGEDGMWTNSSSDRIKELKAQLAALLAAGEKEE